MIRSRIDALEESELALGSILRQLTRTIAMLELADAKFAEQARDIHQRLVAIKTAANNSIHLKPVTDLFEYKDAEFTARVCIPDGWWCWPYDEEKCEFVQGKLEDMEQEERAEVMQAARDWFVAAFGDWFVDMGLARWRDEVWSIVQSVEQVDDETQVAELHFYSKKMAATFRLAHGDNLV